MRAYMNNKEKYQLFKIASSVAPSDQEVIDWVTETGAKIPLDEWLKSRAPMETPQGLNLNFDDLEVDTTFPKLEKARFDAVEPIGTGGGIRG